MSPRDRELALGVAAGDGASIAAAYDLYAAGLYRLLFALLGSAADAEDALQELFVRLAAGRARRVTDLKAYLFPAARNEAHSMLRRRRREALFGIQLWGAGPAPVEHPADDDLLSLLKRLPAEQREVVALKVFEQMTFAEIAVVTKVSLNTAAARYRYAIRRLKTWSEEGTG